MTREHFLQELRIALQGRISQAEVNEQLYYYENYIIEESRKGRTEEQVIDMLGSPRLIAKTIISVSETGKNFSYGNYEEDGQSAGNGYSKEYYSEGNGNNEQSGSFKKFSKNKTFKIRTWLRNLLRILLLVIVIVLFVRIGILLLPIIMGIFMVGSILYIIYKIFSGN